jgi:hypothetical protein
VCGLICSFSAVVLDMLATLPPTNNVVKAARPTCG